MYRERLAETIPRVLGSVAGAAGAAGRRPDEIRLVAVTKGHPLEAVKAALDAGLEDLGENRVGELQEKAARIGREGVRWHMVGHVQRRKVPRLLPVADLIHSVDSLRLAERIDRVAEREERGPVPVLLQVNTAEEERKSGFPWEGALESLVGVAELPRLRVEGLMTMAPLTDDEGVLRATFRRLRELRDRFLDERGDVGGELSMGMTNDLEIAVEEGSTMVRVGTALFGERTESPR